MSTTADHLQDAEYAKECFGHFFLEPTTREDGRGDWRAYVRRGDDKPFELYADAVVRLLYRHARYKIALFDRATGRLWQPPKTPSSSHAAEEPYPTPLLDAIDAAGGLRYVSIGEDADRIVFLGQPSLGDIIDAAEAIAEELQLEDEVLPESEADLQRTSAWLWTSCPYHVPADPDDHPDCLACYATPEDWRLQWTPVLSAEATPVPPWSTWKTPAPPADQQFPVTLWSLD